MPLVNMRDMLAHAHGNKYAVGAFDALSIDFLEAIVRGAERCHAPIILGLPEAHFEYSDFELTMAAAVVAARRAQVPVAIHLDRGLSIDSAVRAIRFGCNGVTVDASKQPFAENVACTRAVVDMAHGCGVPVEGELGHVAGVDDYNIGFPSPQVAQTYVEQTGVDFLSVRLDTAREHDASQLDFDRLAHVNAALNIPLGFHSDSVLSDDLYRRLIENGVAKISCHAAMADVAGASIRASATSGADTGYTDLVRGVRAAIQTEVERTIDRFGGRDQADACLGASQPWQGVAHVIGFNAQDCTPEQAVELLRHGRTELANIPGVQRVATGESVTDDARYRHLWLIEFAHPRVITSYRDHPKHRAFADRHFRPVAADRLSIDYRLTEAISRESTSR